MRRALACQVVIAAARSSVFVRYALWSVVTGPLSEHYGDDWFVGCCGRRFECRRLFFSGLAFVAGEEESKHMGLNMQVMDYVCFFAYALV